MFLLFRRSLFRSTRHTLIIVLRLVLFLLIILEQNSLLLGVPFFWVLLNLLFFWCLFLYFWTHWTLLVLLLLLARLLFFSHLNRYSDIRANWVMLNHYVFGTAPGWNIICCFTFFSMRWIHLISFGSCWLLARMTLVAAGYAIFYFSRSHIFNCKICLKGSEIFLTQARIR